MNRKYVGWALGVGAVVLAVSGCQSAVGDAAKSPDPGGMAASATTVAGVPTPAEVTSVPTIDATTPAPLLSKRWGPKLDAVVDRMQACAPGGSPACAAAVASAGQAALEFESETQETGTEGRYVHAKPEAVKVAGAGAFYSVYKCGTKTPKAADSLCDQRVLRIISGTTTLKTQITRDERDAGLN